MSEIRYTYIKTIFIKIKKKGIIWYLKIYYKKLLKVLIPKYEKLFIFEVDLKKFTRKSDQRKNVKIEIVKNIKEIKPFIERREDWYYHHAKSLFEKDNLCFVGKINDKIVSCLWTSFNEVYLPNIEYLLHVDKDTVPLIDAYTLPEYRNMGIYGMVWNSCINYFKEKPEYTKIYGFRVPSNIRNLEIDKHLKLKHQVRVSPIMKVTLLKIFGLRKHFIKHIK